MGSACLGSPASTASRPASVARGGSRRVSAGRVSLSLNSIFPSMPRPTMLISSRTKSLACSMRVFIFLKRAPARSAQGPQ